jgi:RNA 2',3'-cyclic 3'-phosphodiesterase
MRVFFGLELDPATSLQIADWRDRQLSSPASPVPAANFHITLAFPGSLSGPALERLCLSVDEWLARTAIEGATLTLDRTGYWSKPGIYWLGPSNWPDGLTRLAQKLNSLGAAAGAKRDRNTFQPHITLFRQCSTAPPAPAQIPDITLHYQHFALFESRQGKRGVSYHVMHDWDLHHNKH